MNVHKTRHEHDKFIDGEGFAAAAPLFRRNETSFTA
jgi:hypothetical protein